MLDATRLDDLVYMASAVTARLEQIKEDEWERTLMLVYALTGESISYKDLVKKGKVVAARKQDPTDWDAFNERAVEVIARGLKAQQAEA